MREDLRLGLSFLISIAGLAGVATPLAKAFLAIGGTICGEDFMAGVRARAGAESARTSERNGNPFIPALPSGSS